MRGFLNPDVSVVSMAPRQGFRGEQRESASTCPAQPWLARQGVL